ncbi:hypothetical protein FCV43_08925 [Vibrio genomosp. F6]|uniref:hypothetical protein n=1 Tax=Vibrio genomosp. F6 TaxID=723172 RepID=UPI0010BD5AC8|nr:hypothetical protein [Vibrio genomosp. F6]TKF21942.1 hypothetical protein FCV43_08925 [Vibrio genomosp. F6]
MSGMNKKYKYTRQLLKLAIENGGYRNEDIAVKARLSNKSVAQVSRWRNGQKEATEAQMVYFIKEYGHLLKRRMEHLFSYQEEVSGAIGIKYRKLSGEVIFKHQIRVPSRKGKSIGSTALARLVVIDNEHKYHIIRQIRGGLTQVQLHNGNYPTLYHSDNEEANWLAYSIEQNLDLDEVVASFQNFIASLLSGQNPVDDLYFGERQTQNDSRVFLQTQTQPIEYCLFQKMMKLGLSCDSFPFE